MGDGEFVNEPKDEPTFEESLKASKRFTFRGCEEEGFIAIPKTLFNFMLNVSAYCTDSEANEEGFYNNKKAMFEALDLFYKALDERLSCVEIEKELKK